MSRLRKYGVIVLAATALTGAASLSLAQPAAAAPFHRVYLRGPRWGWRPPVIRFGYYGPHCFVRRLWVRGPYGWHIVVRRFCRYY